MEDLVKRIEKLEFELERAKAYQECLNCIDKYTYYFNAGRYDLIAALWADREDSSVEMAWGTYCGKSGVDKCYLNFHEHLDIEKNGSFFIHSFVTPVLEVAGDGKTASAVFFSPGVETPPPQPGEEAECLWCWIKYGVDFIKVDGVWKIWHLSTFGWFMCDYHKSWAEDSEPGPQPEEWKERAPEEVWPDAPISHKDWTYTTTGDTELMPVPPLPYYTFKDIGYNLCCPDAHDPKICYDEVTGGV